MFILVHLLNAYNASLCCSKEDLLILLLKSNWFYFPSWCGTCCVADQFFKNIFHNSNRFGGQDVKVFILICIDNYTIYFEDLMFHRPSYLSFSLSLSFSPVWSSNFDVWIWIGYSWAIFYGSCSGMRQNCDISNCCAVWILWYIS